ncbi:carbohydrate kinase family protein [Nocardia cyriacigeorgica]|uniref:carbohydrate kinase family protein n=1 Tax=Nocardia cyriacigeorgica TaxID=135487 RepID=UPI002458287A|nr:sugar kinase [Nocardia cyriacigeorgica]
MAQTVICLGAHVFDVQVRPVEAIPDAQGAVLVENIRFGPAGPAAGTAVTLAKLGATVRSSGMIGTDLIGDVFIDSLRRYGVDTSLIRRRSGVQTAASVLPIRPDGSRPAFHAPGANLVFGPADAPHDAIADATHLHFGAPELMGGQAAASILEPARAAGVVTSADILASGDPGVLAWIEPALPHLDYLLPNAEQVLGLTGASDLVEGCRALVQQGVGCVAVTRGPDGALVVTADQEIAVPAFAVEVIDTTGCGDAFSAGFVRGLGLGRSLRDSAVLGCAVAAIVAEGLGSDHGAFDLVGADRFAVERTTL